MKIKEILFLFLFFFNGFSFFVYSQFGSSADSERLSRNVAAQTNKPYMLFENPAGIFDILVPEISLDYSFLYSNFTDKSKFINNTLAFVSNIYNTGFGFGLNQFCLQDWYQKNSFVFGVGRSIFKNFKNIKLGLQAKFLHEKYNLDDYMKKNPVFLDTDEKIIFSFSIGSLYLLEGHNFGIMLENLNQPDLGFYTVEKLPFEIKIGHKYSQKRFNVYSSASYLFQSRNDYNVGVGCEYFFVLRKVMRLTPSFGLRFGNNDFFLVSAGFNVETKNVSISYSYTTNPISSIDVGAQSRVSICYKFLPVDIIEDKVPKKDFNKLLLEKEKLEKELKEKETQMISEQEQEREQLRQKIKELENKLKQKDEQKEEKKQEKILPPKPITVEQPTTEKPQIPKKRYHKVVLGETLPIIAQKYYGDANKWKIIYDANKDKIIRGQVLPDTILEIP